MAAHSAAQESYLLQTAAKILSELQAMGTHCRLIQSTAPWQITMEGFAEDLIYIRTQVCDLMDGRRGTIQIKEAV